MNWPIGLATDAAGNLFIGDSTNNVVREIPAGSGEITTVAGNGTAGYSGDNGPATEAELNSPVGVAVNSEGTVLYIGDEWNGAVRKVDLTSGTITTVASGMWGTTDVALDAAGDVYVADSGDDFIQVINHSTGTMSVFAGNGGWGDGGDSGPATDAQFEWPTGLTVDAAGNVFVTNNWANSVRKINSSAHDISTVAGNASPSSYSGDGQLAAGASLNNPNGVALDAAGDVFIADSFNNVVREVNAATGVISTVAGNGYSGYSGDGGGDGSALTAELNDPQGVLVSNGNLYIADTGNNVVREVDLSTESITTLVGNGTAGYHDDVLDSTS